MKNSEIRMLTPAEVDRIKKAIDEAKSVNDIERLENALSEGSLKGVRDLVPPSTDPLSDIWADTPSKPLIDQNERKRPVNMMPLARKTPRELMEEEQAKKRLTESAHLADVILLELYPKIPRVQLNLENKRKSAPSHREGSKKILLVDCGTALCRNTEDQYENKLIRIVVADFLTDRIIFDLEVAVDEEFQVIDTRPSLTGIESISGEGETLEAVHSKLFAFMSEETLLVTYNAPKCAEALGLRHSRWVSLSDLLAVDPAKKKQAEGRYHIRAVLSQSQLIEGFLGEPIHDRLKHITIKDRMVELNLALIRLMKNIARQKPQSFPILITPPRRPQTIFMTHIPSNWTAEEIKMVLPTALDIEPVELFYDTQANEWRGETHITFFSDRSVQDAFSKLTACTDVFVGWEWAVCGQVSEQGLKNLGSDFGPVVCVRVQDKYLHAPSTLPGKEESRPFGFLSLARYQDALAMAKDPRQIVKDNVQYHVKISKKPITAFKRVPLGDGEDYIEAFVM